MYLLDDVIMAMDWAIEIFHVFVVVLYVNV